MLFVVSGVGIIPLAGWLGRATEQISARTGAGFGGFLNATFGNAAELIIALMALSKGLTTVVKASLTGSIIGNLLLVLGASAFAGGLRFSHQRFNKTAARVSATAMSRRHLDRAADQRRRRKQLARRRPTSLGLRHHGVVAATVFTLVVLSAAAVALRLLTRVSHAPVRNAHGVPTSVGVSWESIRSGRQLATDELLTRSKPGSPISVAFTGDGPLVYQPRIDEFA